MKDFFYEILIDIFADMTYNDGLMGIILGCLIWLVCAVIIALIIFLGFLLIDRMGTDSYSGYGIVIKKEFVPSHTTTTFIMIGKTMMPQVIHHPDSWNVDIETPHGIANGEINQAIYQKIKNGTKVFVTYKKGLLFSTLYVLDIQLAN